MALMASKLGADWHNNLRPVEPASQKSAKMKSAVERLERSQLGKKGLDGGLR
jgi:hypothetical protein